MVVTVKVDSSAMRIRVIKGLSGRVDEMQFFCALTVADHPPNLLLLWPLLSAYGAVKERRYPADSPPNKNLDSGFLFSKLIAPISLQWLF